MVVSREQALDWELDVFESSGGWSDEPVPLPKNVTEHFVRARTLDWETRRAEYRTWRALRLQDNAGDPDGDWSPTPSRLKKSPGEALRERIAEERQFRIGKEFHGFMSLPREIRDIIYAFSLVRGKIVVPNNEVSLLGETSKHTLDFIAPYNSRMYQRYEGLGYQLSEWRTYPMIYDYPGDQIRLFSHHPRAYDIGTFGLIRGVNRTIHQEAYKVFFSKNQFIFPAGNCDLPNLQGLEDEGVDQTDYAPWLRDVSYTFDMRDAQMNDFENRYDNVNAGNIDDDEPPSPQEALQLLHTTRKDWLEAVWAEKASTIRRMELNRLQVAFDECFCGYGCCRMVEWVCDQLTAPDVDPESGVATDPWEIRPPLTVEIFGWNNEQEKLLIENRFAKLRSVLPSFKISFIGLSLSELRASQRRR